MLKKVLRLFSISIIICLVSCAKTKPAIPVYEGINVRDVLNQKSNISFIDTVFSIKFKRTDTEINGDGVLNIERNGDLNLRIFSLGFLALEMTSNNDIIKSNPKLDRNKGIILTHGLRDCLFWWDIKEYEIQDTEDIYILRNPSRIIWIDKRSMLPVKQTIAISNTRVLNIFYENPEREGDIWYSSKITIKLSNYSVTMKIKRISFTPHHRMP